MTKWIGKYLLMMIVVFVNVTPTYAADRVIYEFEQKTNNSGGLKLYWQNGEYKNQNIRITGYDVLNNYTILVTYKTGETVKRNDYLPIYIPKVTFPAQIVLKDEIADEIPLKDINEESQSYYPILNLYSQGIINGYPDGTFKPMKNVTREEFAKIVVSTAKYVLDKGSNSKFVDVSDDRWSKDYIMTLSNKDIIKGKGKDNFAPSDTIKIGEVAAIIDRTFSFHQKNAMPDIEVQNKHWSDGNIYSLLQSGIIHKDDEFYTNYNPDKFATREECTLLLNRVLMTYHDTN